MNDDEPTLIRVLRTRRLIANRRVDGTVRVESIAESLLTPLRSRAHRGLLQLLPVIAARGGPSFMVCPTSSISPLPSPVVVEKQLPQLLSPHVVNFVHSHEQGVIRFDQSVSRIQLIGEIALAFPEESMAVITANLIDAKKVQSDLYRMGIRAQRLVAAREPQMAGRIVIGTFSSMAHPSVELEKRNILIIYKAKDALSERAQLPLTAPDLRGRLFGFLPFDEKLSPLEEDRLATTFGFHQIDVPAHGHQLVDVNMEWSTFSAARTVGETAQQLKKHGLWRCAPRHRTIARLARQARSEHRVVVLAESLEHVAQLAQFLPDWPIRFDDSCEPTGLAETHIQRLRAGRSRWILGTELIATPAGLASIRPGTFDLLIWAGGGPGIPPIPQSHLKCPSGVSQRLTIVDLHDRHHPQLRRWSRLRKNWYQHREWFERSFSTPLDFCRANRFLEKLIASNQ